MPQLLLGAYQENFKSSYGYTGQKAEYADWSINYLYQNRPDLIGMAPDQVGQNQRQQIEERMVAGIRDTYGLGPIAWFFLQWAIVKIIQLAIDYWLSREA